jgi:hypothetical protein
VEGHVFGTFRDSARVLEQRVFILGIERVERRIETRDSVEWRKVWPPDDPVKTDSLVAAKSPRGTPAPAFIFAFDLGQNFRSGTKSYAGVAAGFLTSAEGGFVPLGAVRVGGARSSSRYELRADAFFTEGFAVIMSLAIGFGSRD